LTEYEQLRNTPEDKKISERAEEKYLKPLLIYNKGSAQVNEKKRTWGVRSRECRNKKNGVEAPHGLWKM
jgi:hypothetical protein